MSEHDIVLTGRIASNVVCRYYTDTGSLVSRFSLLSTNSTDPEAEKCFLLVEARGLLAAHVRMSLGRGSYLQITGSLVNCSPAGGKGATVKLRAKTISVDLRYHTVATITGGPRGEEVAASPLAGYLENARTWVDFVDKIPSELAPQELWQNVRSKAVARTHTSSRPATNWEDVDQVLLDHDSKCSV